MNTKKNIIGLFAIGFMLACSSPDKSPNDSKTEILSTPTSTTGKTFDYNYGDNVYQVKFLTDSTLHWKCLKGDALGKESTERFYAQTINDNQTLFTWVETDGLGVSEVVDFDKKTVNTFLRIDKKIIPLKGTIKEI